MHGDKLKLISDVLKAVQDTVSTGKVPAEDITKIIQDILGLAGVEG